MAARHRALVYCQDDTPSEYTPEYGWWCMGCSEHQLPSTTKQKADKAAKAHMAKVEAERARLALEAEQKKQLLRKDTAA